jgi:FO synthase subunit 2
MHPAFALDKEHRATLKASARGDLNYRRPGEYDTNPGTYCEQMTAMSVDFHSMTPEEAYHALRGTDWDYEEVYSRLKEAGLKSVPGTAAEILVDEVRQVISPRENWHQRMVQRDDSCHQCRARYHLNDDVRSRRE